MPLKEVFMLRKIIMLLSLWSFSSGQWAQAAFAVFDAQNLMQMLTDNIATVEQWGIDNQKQLEQLQQLIQSNTWAQTNSTLNQRASWQVVETARQETLALVHATSSIWQQCGQLSRFLATMKSSEAWLACARSGSCSFENYLRDLDESTVKIAQNAAAYAERMQVHLGQKAQALERLKTNGQTAKGQADIMDNMSKINAEIASSMIDLNGQSTQLISLITKAQALKADERQSFMAQEQYFEAKTGWHSQPHLEMTLPAFK